MNSLAQLYRVTVLNSLKTLQKTRQSIRPRKCCTTLLFCWRPAVEMQNRALKSTVRVTGSLYNWYKILHVTLQSVLYEFSRNVSCGMVQLILQLVHNTTQSEGTTQYYNCRGSSGMVQSIHTVVWYNCTMSLYGTILQLQRVFCMRLHL